MKLLQNTLIHNNIVAVLQGLCIAAIAIAFFFIFDFLHIVTIAFIASIGLQSWCQLNPCYPDYITSAEAPLASLSFLIVMIITQSVPLSITVTLIVLLAYHYFFSSSEVYRDTYFTALLFSIVFLFISAYLNHIGTFDDYPGKIIIGVRGNTLSIIIISTLMSMLHIYLSKLKYELSIISLGSNYYTLLPFNETVFPLIISITKAVVTTFIFLLIGWMGALLTTIPLLRKSNQIISVIVLTIIISSLLYAQHYISPLYIIIPIVIIDFFFVFIHAKRLPCSS
ncbi:MAG: hypothetical protein N3F66_09305 [Spirochaetes bacterium]|nr:hypothetical protein [Spirochaetota bacterium]